MKCISLQSSNDKNMKPVIETNSLKAWILASRPKTWAAAIAPVVVGCALAYHYGSFNLFQSLFCLLFAVTMQIAANLINDLFDFLKGSDGEDRLGPQRATAQGWITPEAMKKGIVAVIASGCLFGLLILLPTLLQNPIADAFKQCCLLILVGVTCVIFAYCYTSGPFPLAYNGLGDVSVILFFGIVATGFTAYVQVLQWHQSFFLYGLAIGCVVDTLLVLNNYRDRETDEKSGKKTSVVRHGERFGRILYFCLGIVGEAIAFTLFSYTAKEIAKEIAMSTIIYNTLYKDLLCILFTPTLVCIYLIPHFLTWSKICEIRSGMLLNSLIGATSRNMILFAITLSFGIVFSNLNF